MPDSKVFIDPRTGVLLFPKGFVGAWKDAAETRPGWRETFERGHPDFALLSWTTTSPPSLPPSQSGSCCSRTSFGALRPARWGAHRAARAKPGEAPRQGSRVMTMRTREARGPIVLAMATWSWFFSPACPAKERPSRRLKKERADEAKALGVAGDLDTTRADRLGCYGNKDGLTPFLDEYARKSHLFTRCESAVPLTCRPTQPS